VPSKANQRHEPVEHPRAMVTKSCWNIQRKELSINYSWQLLRTKLFFFFLQFFLMHHAHTKMEAMNAVSKVKPNTASFLANHHAWDMQRMEVSLSPLADSLEHETNPIFWCVNFRDSCVLHNFPPLTAIGSVFSDVPDPCGAPVRGSRPKMTQCQSWHDRRGARSGWHEAG
jgi:hypothetical protein